MERSVSQREAPQVKMTTRDVYDETKQDDDETYCDNSLNNRNGREQTSAEYAISITSWLIGANALLKQLKDVENDEKEEGEEVNDEFEDCSDDQHGEEHIVETGDTNKEEQMSREGLVAFVKQDDEDVHSDTDDDPIYSPSTEKSDTEDDLSEEEEEDDEGNESDLEEKDQVMKLAEKKRNKERMEDKTTDEESSEEEMEDTEKIKRNIFGRKRSIAETTDFEFKKRKSCSDDDMEEGEEDKRGDANKHGKSCTRKEEEEHKEEITETQRSILEAAEEGLYDNLDDEEMFEESLEDNIKIGRQDERLHKVNIAEDDSSYQSDAEGEEEEEQVCTIFEFNQYNFQFSGGLGSKSRNTSPTAMPWLNGNLLKGPLSLVVDAFSSKF